MFKQYVSIGVMPVICALLLAVVSQSSVSAQRVGHFGQPYTPPSTSFRPGNYQQGIAGTRYNPTTNSTHIPGQAVIKNSGVYNAVGGGYYRNQQTGNIYNPTTGSYTTGKTLTFKPGTYQQGIGGTRYNPTTGSTHIPGKAVIKSSGVYRPIGGGYYQNPNTGNVYNPTTGAYKSR